MSYIKVFALALTIVGMIGLGISQEVERPARVREAMTFRASPAKTRFLPLEPIPLRFTYSNDTQTAIEATPPNFFSIQIESTDSSGIKTRLPVSFISVSRMALPRKFEPGESIAEDALLITNLAKLFPTPGEFQVRFVLPGGGQGQDLTSDSLSFTIEKPVGIDADALRALRKNQEGSSAPDELFRWNGSGADQARNEKLESFVDTYQLSRYGDYAALYLGNYYLARGNAESATLLFGRIAASSISIVSSEAKKGLEQAAAMRREKENESREN